MFIPNADKAVVDLRKLRDYCLNPHHEVGMHKARLFAAALNLNQKHASILRQGLLEAVKANKANLGVSNEFGQRYIVDFEFEWNGNKSQIRSVWIIDAGLERPRLITCLPI
jgi:hypothetical protein